VLKLIEYYLVKEKIIWKFFNFFQKTLDKYRNLRYNIIKDKR
jgi:hypothetical protein